MYFLFTTVLTVSFLIKSEFTAVTFTAEVLYTVAYLILFSVYFQKNRDIHVFIPLLLVSFALHLVFFLMELQKDYIKGINVWILVCFCSLSVFYNRSDPAAIQALPRLSICVRRYSLLCFSLQS
jgi:hypothetical protein